MSRLSEKLKGTGVAVVTPFTKKGIVDFDALIRVTNHIIKGKADYIIPLGSTGESAVLRMDEKLAIVDCVVDTVNQRIPVVLGLGGNNTMDIVQQYSTFNFEGIDAILSVSPAYNKPTQEGIKRHFKAIAEAPVPVILYNVPGRTSSNMEASTTLELAHSVKNIIGIKEASGNMEQIMRILKDRPDGFLVISGDDALAVPLIAMGADGVISVVANAFPKQWSEMIQQAMKGDFKKAAKTLYRFIPFVDLIFRDGNPSGIKEALLALGLTTNEVRLPLVPVSANTSKEIRQFIKSARGTQS